MAKRTRHARTRAEREFGRQVVAEARAIRAVGRARLRADIDLTDFVQETMARAIAGSGGLRDGSKLGAWVATIARNLAQEWNQVAGPVADDGLAERRSPDPTPLAHALRVEQLRRAGAAMRTLDADDRDLLRGYYAEDVGCVELRGRLQLSHAAVRMRLHRAREALRKRIGLITTGIAATLGIRLDAATGGVLAMNTAMKVTLVAVGVSALVVGGVAWRARGDAEPPPADPVATLSEGTTATRAASEAHVVGTDGAGRVRVRRAPSGAEATGTSDAEGAVARMRVRAAPDAGSEPGAGGIGTPTPAREALEPAAPTHELTAGEQRVYDELERIFPLKDAVMRDLAAAAQDDPNMERLDPILQRLQALDATLEQLVPDAFKREGEDGMESVMIDMDRIREAAGGTLPYEPPRRNRADHGRRGAGRGTGRRYKGRSELGQTRVT